MPPAEEILENLTALAEQGWFLSPLFRLALLAIVAYGVRKRRLPALHLAAFAALILVAVSMAAVGFKNHTNPATFFLLFPLGILWGREALVLPQSPSPSIPRLAVAALFALAAFFYPHFDGGLTKALLLAPVGIWPCPTLILALAITIAAGRTYGLITALPTWIVALFYGLAGVFYLHVKVDWILIVAAPVSAVAYLLSKPPARKKKLRKRRK